MQTQDAITSGYAKKPKLNYLTNGSTLSSWLLTKDHKRIAIMYLITVSLFFMMGGLYAATIRLELLTPASDLVETGTYNKVFTQHGILMIFFFLIPSIPAILGNFLIPIMIGAKDLALPRINLISLYIYWIGGGLTVYALMQGGSGSFKGEGPEYAGKFAQPNIIVRLEDVQVDGKNWAPYTSTGGTGPAGFGKKKKGAPDQPKD